MNDVLCAALLAAALGCQKSASSPPEDPPQMAMPALEEAGAAKCAAARTPIVFHSARAPAVVFSHLYLMAADGSGLRRIAGDPITEYHSSVWSPDGRSIAFRRMAATDSPVTDVPAEIGLIDPDTTERLSLLQDDCPISPLAVALSPPDGPSWSLDGTELAYATRDATGVWAVWLMSVTGGDLRRLLPDFTAPHFAPSWSPGTPSRLAFVAELDGARDIWVVDADLPGEPSNLTAGMGEFTEPQSLRWSPDGSTLAFSAIDPAPAEQGGGDREIYLLDVEQRTLSRFTTDTYQDITPAWSPDGSSLLVASDRVAFTSSEVDGDRRHGFDIWRVPLDDQIRAVRLTDGTGSNAAPDWFELDDCP